MRDDPTDVAMVVLDFFGNKLLRDGVGSEDDVGVAGPLDVVGWGLLACDTPGRLDGGRRLIRSSSSFSSSSGCLLPV